MTSKSTAPAAGDQAASEKAAGSIEVKLAKPHTHNRQEHAAGKTIKVTAAERDFLISVGVVAAPKEA